MCMVIGVERDCSDVRLNTTKSPKKESIKWEFRKILPPKYIVFQTKKDFIQHSALFGMTSCTLCPSGVCRTGPWLHGSTLINKRIDSNATHTHVAVWPTVSKARLQKFPLLIVLRACVRTPSAPPLIKAVKQRRRPRQDTGHPARGGPRPRGSAATL